MHVGGAGAPRPGGGDLLHAAAAAEAAHGPAGRGAEVDGLRGAADLHLGRANPLPPHLVPRLCSLSEIG